MLIAAANALYLKVICYLQSEKALFIFTYFRQDISSLQAISESEHN